MENSSRNKKNEYDVKMCSRQEDKHTNDQGWTTIDTNSNRKPKSKTNNNTTIDSIISSIDVEFNIDTNGTLEANIASPTRKNRCIVPDKKVYDRKNTCTITKQEQRTVTKPTEEEERKETTSTTTREGITKNINCKQRNEHEEQETEGKKKKEKRQDVPGSKKKDK
jgi:hypothetical protein